MGIYELTPWDVADRLFRPDDEAEYPGAIEWLSTWRSRIGLLAIIYFNLSHGVWPFDEISILTNMFATAFISAFVALASVGLLLLSTSRPISQSMKSDCKAVVRRVLWFFASLTTLGLASLIPVLNIIAAFWGILFLWCALWLMAKYLFGAGQAHPMLAPLVLAATSGLLAIYNLSEIGTSKIPPRIDKLIIFSGCGTTVLLSLTEVAALWWRSKHETAQPGEAAVNSAWTTAPYQARRRFPLKIVLTAVSLVILAVLAIPLYGAVRHFGSGHAATQPPGTGVAANPARGTLTIRSGHDYLLALGKPYPIARVGGADVGHLTGTPSGVEIYEAYALPLPTSAKGSQAACLALNWTGDGLRTVGHVIPWAQLKHGRRFCVQTTYGGTFISLLTVRSLSSGQATFQVVTWACNPRPDESAIC